MSVSLVPRSDLPGCRRGPQALSLLRSLVACALVAAAAGCGGEEDLVISGRVEVETIRIGSRIAGRVARVHADEGDIVAADAPVVTLEPRELDAQLAQARASLAQSQAQLDLLLAGSRSEDVRRAAAVVAAREAELALRRAGFRDEEVREAEAQLSSAQTALDLSTKELERARLLFEQGTVEQNVFDQRTADFETTRAAADIAAQRLALLRSGSRPEEIAAAEAALEQARADLERLRNGARPEEIAAARAAVAAAEANAERLDAQLAETVIRAPIEAMVETLDLQPGDLIAAGTPVAVLQLRQEPWVRCYVPENRLGAVRPGQRVAVTVDSLPGEALEGIVRRVASEAEFTPRNVQTVEKRSELVFEVKVDVVRGGERLRAGMYADVRVPPAAADATAGAPEARP